MKELPEMCAFHGSIFATRLKQIDGRVHHPGAGRKALIAQAEKVSDQCCRKALDLPPRWRP